MNVMFRIASVLAALIVAASFAFAGEVPISPQDDGFERDVQIAQNVTEETRRNTVAANLPLTDSQGKAFWPVYLEYRAAVGEQNVRLAKLIDGYARAYATMSADEAKQLTHTYLDIDRKRLKLKEEYLKKFEKVLPAMLVARAMQTEQKLDAMQTFTLARAIPLVPPADR
jgi:hypothetical protein